MTTNSKTLKLESLGSFYKGTGIPRDSSDSGELPAVRYGELYTDYDTFISGKTRSNISEIIAEGAFKLEYGDILMAGSGETPEDIGKSAVFLSNKGYAGGDIIVFRPDKTKVNPKFLAYYFETESWKKQRRRVAQGQSIVHIHATDLKKMIVKLPDLETQQKIVQILDSFEQDISLYKKRVEKEKRIRSAFTKKLLDRTNRTTQKAYLGDIANVYQPKTIPPSEIAPRKYPIFGANGIIGYHEQYNHEKEQVTISCRGANCGTVNYTPKKCWITGNSMVINIDNSEEKVDKLYLYYYLSSSNLSCLISGSGIPQIIGSATKKYVIPLPDLKYQKDISLRIKTQVDLISALENQIKQYEKLRKYLLNHLICGDFDLSNIKLEKGKE